MLRFRSVGEFVVIAVDVVDSGTEKRLDGEMGLDGGVDAVGEESFSTMGSAPIEAFSSWSNVRL